MIDFGPYGEPPKTLEEVEAFPDEELFEGYRDGFRNEYEPNGNRTRAYWHGWRNGQVDAGWRKSDWYQQELARLYMQRERRKVLERAGIMDILRRFE